MVSWCGCSLSKTLVGSCIAFFGLNCCLAGRSVACKAADILSSLINTYWFPGAIRFYVSLFSSSSSSSSFSSASSSVSLSCRDSVCSVWHVGPQLRSCEFSVACWTSTAILRVQCGVPDPNCDLLSSVWRAGPQPRSREFSMACRTPTASP